jgi:Mrp family chromosome partitioning ATPase
MSGSLAVLRRGWWILASCLVVIPAAVYVQTARQPEVYEASAIVEGDPARQFVTVGAIVVANPASASLAARYATGPQVARDTARTVAERHGTAASLSSALDDRTGWITLTAAGPDATAVVATANVGADVLRRTLRELSDDDLAAAIDATERSLAASPDPEAAERTADQLRQLRAARRTGLEEVRTIQRASEAEVIAPHPGRNTTLAVVLALLAAPGLMLLAAAFDRTLRTPGQLEALTEAPLLASLGGPGFGSDPSRTREGFARLRDALSHFDLGGPSTPLVVASPLPREGRTTIAAGLAGAFARAGHRVVVVDADMRNGDLARRLGVAASPGLADVLAGGSLDAALHGVPADDHGLVAVPAGWPVRDPGDLLAADRLSATLDELARRFDVVVIDTPPFLGVSDALPLVRHASGVVCVARIDQTPRRALRRMRDMVAAAGARIAGAVATGAGRAEPARRRTTFPRRAGRRTGPPAHRAG